MGMERWSEEHRTALSALVALVVAAVLVAGWALAQRGSNGTGGGTAGVGAGATGGGVAGDPGSGAAGGGGSVDRGADPGADQPAVGRGPVLAEGAVRVDSYVVRDRRLLVNYTNGVAECYGEVAVGAVRERGDAVTVTLRAVPPVEPAEVCIDIAVTGTLAVELQSPLGQRWVLDGGFEPEVQVRRVRHPHGDPFPGPAVGTEPDGLTG